jgi:8-oxo-dGTP diphosphatase
MSGHPISAAPPGAAGMMETASGALPRVVEQKAQHMAPTTRPAGVIVIVAAVIVDGAGRLLLVRKRGTHRFMQAGGKIDPGEAAADALARELHEELGVVVEASDLEYLGRFDADAANEAGFVVDARVYAADLGTGAAAAVASAEIDELVWVTPAEALDLPLAPLTSDVLMPLLVERSARARAR